MSKRAKTLPHAADKLTAQPHQPDSGSEFRKNYLEPCMNCDQKPTVGDTGLCGPCCFGEASTVGGNW